MDYSNCSSSMWVTSVNQNFVSKRKQKNPPIDPARTSEKYFSQDATTVEDLSDFFFNGALNTNHNTMSYFQQSEVNRLLETKIFYVNNSKIIENAPIYRAF